MNKRLFFLVPIILLFALFGNSAMQVNPTVHNQENNWANRNASQLEKNTLSMINGYRNSQGLPDLILDNLLTASAKYHSNQQANTGKIYHQDLSDYSHINLRHGIAENVAMNSYSNTVEVAIRGWINSPGHNANILSQNYTHTGIGVTERDGVYYYTQLFGY